MKWNYWPVMLAFMLFSCDNQTIYKQFDSNFEHNRWQRADVRSYEFTVEQAKAYDLFIDFSYVAGVQFAQIPITVEITTPDGKITQESNVLQTKDSQGDESGDCAGDYCDLRHTVFQKKELEKGNYKIRLKNEFNNAFLPNVIGIGIRVSAAQ